MVSRSNPLKGQTFFLKATQALIYLFYKPASEEIILQQNYHFFIH